MEPHELERLRRSVAMMPAGSSSTALPKEAAEALLEELHRLDELTARYEHVISQLRSILSTIEE